MAVARGETVVEGVEGVYHCTSRCVRRAFLCGRDSYTGKSFEHRKAWVRSRLEFLASVFALEVWAFAVMSNHLHVVLGTRPDWVEQWSDEETARRWLLLFPKNKAPGADAAGPARAELDALAGISGKIGEIRVRLSSVSWFMRCLNEPIARRANREDGCKGRFWEGRFHCQALLDDSAVLACMAYVDLNPVRAGAADSPQNSSVTSGYLRIKAQAARDGVKRASPVIDASVFHLEGALAPEQRPALPDRWLTPLDDEKSGPGQGRLAMSAEEYLELLSWTGRLLREGRKGTMPENLDQALVRFSIDRGNWPTLVESYGRLFFRAVGRPRAMTQAARNSGRRWLHGVRTSRSVFFSAGVGKNYIYARPDGHVFPARERLARKLIHGARSCSIF
ncbi:MAG: hypothetical protein V1816_24600 [Pseudomonadota bacterium]